MSFFSFFLAALPSWESGSCLVALLNLVADLCYKKWWNDVGEKFWSHSRSISCAVVTWCECSRLFVHWNLQKNFINFLASERDLILCLVLFFWCLLGLLDTGCLEEVPGGTQEQRGESGEMPRWAKEAAQEEPGQQEPVQVWREGDAGEPPLGFYTGNTFKMKISDLTVK